MASRRQKQFERKYSSFKRYTATEDVNYNSHSAKSSYRSESLTSRSDSRGRSTQFEVVAGSDTRSFPVYIAIQDYQPDGSEVEGIALEQGQIVEVLDKKNSARWLVRTKARPPLSGWVPGSYFETPTEYYKQRRKTREIEHPSSNITEEQEAILKRDQVYHDLLRSEEEFVTDFRACIEEFVNPLDDPSVPEEVQQVKEVLKSNLTELYHFHANVMLKGLNYYSDDPGKVGQTFVRLERDFDQHVQFYKTLPTVLEKLENAPIKEYFESLADKCEAGARSYADHLKNVADRMTHYQNYFKEFVKYSARANVSTKSMQKALELCICVPQRVNDLDYTDNIKEYPGDTDNLGRLIRHDMFKVEEGEGNPPNDRYVFLFKNKVMITEKLNTEPVSYKHYATIRLDKYSVRTHSVKDDMIILKPNEQGLPSFTLLPTDVSQSEFVRKAWLRDIAEEHEEYAQNRELNTDVDITISEAPSNVNDYSSSSRKSSTITGPEEGGPPRKKIKSPPVISPTGSTTSIYSGGSSGIDWATTGTTLEMQGTRVTRTQYGFRTLQESSAKMCLKVTGYPLPEITWYKDDVQLHEDERHKFYADEDGFFAMTIDPVQVEDTGRYTCMATNEYGQASTSAFFRVLKVEKEAAPPAFVNNLKDQECKEGEVVNFECEVEGWPEPELVWLVDDQPLRPSHDFKPSYDGQYAKLEIRDAQPDDTGVYTVKIQNEFGSTESKAELVVQADPDKNHVAPEFQQMIDDVECNEGDEVKFKAVITGDPNPEITWMINGIPLSESEKIRFISEDGICILIIKDVTRHFDGIVTCQGTNRLGQATCDGRLKVRIPPAPPTFNKLLEDKVVQEKAQAVFEVDVNGWPEPTVVFTLKGKELKHGEGGVDIQGADGFYRLTISDCSIEDHDGEIVAKATNEHGSAESRARLTVEQPEEESRSAPTFIKDIEDQTVKSGQQAVFETTVRGNPNPDVTWYINGHKMDESSPGIKIEVVNHDHKITIDSAQYAGTVLCRAENSVGRFETKARLIVLPQETPKKPPQFTEKLVDKTETEQNTVVFEARVEAEPKADLKWYLNGQELTQSERVEIREFDGSVKLELRNLTLLDAGEIKCVATNSEGSAETSAKLIVNKKPFGPRFIETPKSVTVQKGEEAVFRAQADGVPEPEYQWSIDGRKIRASTDGASVQIENGVSVLRLNTSVFSASSTISVVAENSVGNDETGCRLTVEEKPTEAAKLVDKTQSQEQKHETDLLEQVVGVETTANTDHKTASASIESVIEISSIEQSVTSEQSCVSQNEQSIGVEVDVESSNVQEEIMIESSKPSSDNAQQEDIPAEPKTERMDSVTTDTILSENKLVSKDQEAASSEEPEKLDEGISILDNSKMSDELKDKERSAAQDQKIPIVIIVSESDDEKTGVMEELTAASPDERFANTAPEEVNVTTEVVNVHSDEVKFTAANVDLVTEEIGSIQAPEIANPVHEEVNFTSELVSTATEEKSISSQIVNDSSEKEDLPIEETINASEQKSPAIEEPILSAEASNITSQEVELAAESIDTVPETVSVIAQEEKLSSGEVIVTSEKTENVTPENADMTTEKEVIVPSDNEAVLPQDITRTELEKIESNSAEVKSDLNKKEEETTVKTPEVLKPVITRDLKSQTVNKGDIAHFEVVIENATEIHWFHNGTEVFDNNKDINLSNDDKFEFRLSLDSNTFTNGTISVTGSNSSGSVTTKCEMKVLEELKETKKPEFTDALKDLEVTRDDSFRLDVIALHSPKYKWYINGAEVEDGKDGIKIINEENKSTLMVDKASDFHDGKVTVVASNEVGSTESSCRVSVLQKSTPPVISDLLSKEVKEGETVEFKTTVTGYPEPTVQWILNEQVVSQSEKITISKTNTEYTLSIRETVTSQQGTVQIKAQNSAGSDEKSTSLKVTQVIKAPQFSAQLSDRSVEAGEPLRFDVKLNEPSPGTDIVWLLNGSELKPGENCQISDHGDGSYHLTIPEAKPDHNQSVLTCKAVNPAGTSETSAKIEVRSAKKKPEFIQKPQNHDTYIDESVKFSAVVTGLPAPQVSWYLNGKKLEHSDEVKVKYDSETGKTSIRIHKPQESHSGEVKVVLENEVGSVEATATLKVEHKCEVPKFVSNMDDRQVNEGDNVSFTASVQGFPAPEVVWTLNGEPVSKHPNITVTDENGEHVIEISSITPEQSGELSCQASNSVGLKKQNVQLAVKMSGEAPMFTKNLEDRLVTESETTFMEAKLKQVKPKPVVKWFRDGKELVPDEHWKIEEHEDGTLQLRIVTTTLEDKGRITITAENHFGSAECAASLGVVKGRPLAKPAFQSNIAPITLTEGDSLQTKLLITGDPTPFVKWYIGGQLVCETEDTEIKNSNGVYSLTIHGVTADMTGKIKCVAYNKAGEVSTEGDLKVIAPIPVEFETVLCDATCREGDTLKLKAVLLGEPTPVVSWYVNGKKLVETQNIKIHAEKGTYTVTIKDITCDYSGKVVCEAVNEYGTASSEAMLLVLPRGEPPDFGKWLRNVTASEGSQVVQMVEFTGDPKPVLTWYINNEVVVPNDNITIVTDDKTSVLTIKSFNPNLHVGEIICKAENEAGEVSCTANMTKYTGELNGRFSESDSERQTDGNRNGDSEIDDDSFREEHHRTPTPVMAPRFITKIKDTSAKKGHSAIFECVVPDTKGVCCKWLKDGKEIELIARIRVTPRTIDGTTTHELILDDIQPEDAGKYSVIVENSAGREICEATLTVIEALEKPADRAPDFSVQLQDKKVSTSDKVLFECKVDGLPAPTVVWYHDTVKIEQSSRITIESTTEGVQRLSISSTEIKDEGSYSCVAENSAGTAKTEAKLVVQAEAPTFTKKLEDKKLDIGEKLVLSCSVKGQPQPHVDFFRDTVRMTSNERVSVEHDATNTHWRLVITNVTKEEIQTTYRAVATNAAGEATSEARVSSKTVAPTFEQGLKKTSVREKDEIRMEVRVSGTEPDVKWQKDGQPVEPDANHELLRNPETGTYTLVVRQASLADAGNYTVQAVNPAGQAESSAEAGVEQALVAPYFEKELAETQVSLKESATLSISVKGVPQPTVEWLKDGKPVQVDGQNVIKKAQEDGQHQLIISSARFEDAGSYSCRAVNPAGQATTQAKFAVVRDLRPPEFVEKLQPLEVKETESLRLTVRVTGSPEPDLKWFKDGQPLKIDDDHVILRKQPDGRVEIEIKDAQLSDCGSYSVQATNTAGQANTQAQMAVTSDVVKPHFIEGLKTLDVEQGQDIRLQVHVEGFPEPDVVFTKDGVKINVDNQHMLERDSQGHHTLIIRGVSNNDIGSYTCTATNRGGSDQTIGELKIPKYSFEKTSDEEVQPFFEQPLTEQTVTEGETTVLTCRVNKESKAQIQWFKDDKPIEIDGHMVTEQLEDGTIKLTIQKTTGQDVGKYRCEAVNKAGKAETTAPLSLQYASQQQEQVDDESGQMQEMPVEHVPQTDSAKDSTAGSDRGAPEFVELLRSCTVQIGKQAVLKCRVKGEPRPKIKWSKDGKEVEMSARIRSDFKDDGTLTLTIDDAQQNDAGEYRCEADNEYGSAWTEGPIIVTREGAQQPDGGAPDFLQPVRPVVVTEGEVAVLEGKISGEPRPTVKWYKNGEQLKDGDRIKIEDLPDGTQRLTIKDAKLSDQDEYRCEAGNEHGDVWSDVTLTVKEKTDEAPVFQKELSAVAVIEGQTAHFEARVTGLPRPEVQWFKDDKPVTASTEMHLESSADGTEKLILDHAKIEDQGTFRIEAVNAAGKVSSSAPLQVQPDGDKLKLKEPLRDVTVEQGLKIRLSVEVEGKPKTVKWYKGADQIQSDNRVTLGSVSDSQHFLEIQSSELNDASSYRVVLSTEKESVESACTVTVKEGKAHLPSFRKGLNDQEVPKGQPLVLEVEIDGKPKSVKWIGPNGPLTGEDLGNGKYRLTVPDFKDSDIGNYAVEAENEAGIVESRAKVAVKSSDDDGKDKNKPEIVSGLIPTSVDQGETARFTVKTKGPVKKVTWYKNGKEIGPDDGVKPIDNGDGTYSLEIPNAQLDSAGDFRVAVSNDAGEVDSSAALTVKPSDDGKDKNKPEIVQGLIPTTVDQGETARFTVKTKGPVKKVTWYKNGKEVKPEDGFKPIDNGDGTYSLEIPNAQLDSAGDFRVAVSNDAGEVDSSAALTVKPSDDGKDKNKPEIVQGLIPTTVDQGETARFTVKTKGPVKKVTWYKNGKEVKPEDGFKPIDNGDGTYSLEIPNAQLDSAGDFRVAVSNDAGEVDSSAALTVKPSDDGKDKNKPQIVQGLIPTTVDQGDTAKFIIKTKGPVKKVTWYKNGKELGPSDGVKPTDNGDGSYGLEIPNAQMDAAGDFKVVVANDAGDDDSSAALTVKLPAEKPKIVKGLEDVVLPVGSPLKLEIQTAGNPKTVKWYKNGKEIAGSAAAQIELKKIDDNNYILTIPKSAIEDSGDYRVEIENEAGKAESAGKVEVEPKLTFLKPLKDLEVTEGDQAEFVVETNAKPRSVKWYKNGQEVTPDGAKLTVQSTGNTYRLTIPRTVREDAGDFKVVLENSAGPVDSSAKLTVKKSKPPVPKIIKPLEDQVVAKGSPLVFEVKVGGEVDDVKWSKDASPLSASDRIKIDKIDDQTYRLTIPSAELSDAGLYTVEAVNAGGKANSDAKGEVDEKPEIVKGLADTTVNVGDDDVFKVETSAPIRSVKWYKNGQEIAPSGHFEPKKIGPKKYELGINRAVLEDGATYRVVLSNAAGECDSSANLTVIKPDILKILDGLKDVDVPEGTPAELKVRVEGKPKSVKWYKNGQEIKPTDDLKLVESPESGEYSLVIPSSKKSDGGAYRVELGNDNGEVSSGAVLHVKPAKQPSTECGAGFLTPLQDVEVEEGETLTLSCRVSGDPFPTIRWEKDGQEIKKDDRIAMREALDGTITLRIRDAKKSDIGQYRVHAENSLGSSTSACMASVKDKGEEPSKPRFIIPLKSVDAAPGDKREFNIKLRGCPKPTLEWLLNEEPLKFDDRVSVEDLGAGNYCLTIRDIKESDYGTLRCRASNELGKDECQAELGKSTDRQGRDKDDDRYPPRFNVPLWDRRIPVNDPMFIECHVDAKPTATIVWFKDGKILESSEGVEVRNTTDGACRVKIQQFSEKHCGVYKCEATNELGVADTLSTYSVEVPVVEELVQKKEYAPKFNPGLEDRNANAGQPVKLSCHVDAVPRAAVTWYKDGLPLRPSEKISIEYGDDGNCQLVISSTQESDAGAYRCVATNEHGSTNTSGLVNVKVPKQEIVKDGEEPFFTKGLVDIWTDRGETFTMKCCVKGDPTPEIKWYRNGQLVRNGPRCIIDQLPDGTCQLTVKECTMSDEGVYRCEAENRLGKAKTQATAHVQMAIGKSDKLKLDEGQPPRFVVPLEDQTVVLGSCIELSCKVTGQPMPNVKWSKDGAPIWEESRHDWEIDEAKGTYQLKIKNATVNDEGTYRCVATNESGSATTKAFIRIDDGSLSAASAPKSTPPRFTIALGDARAVEGQPLKFECKIEGFPLPELTWHKDGAQIQSSDRCQITLDEGGNAKLLIPSCTMDDDGIYRVIATNPSGSARDKGTGTVKRAPKDTSGGLPKSEFDVSKVPKLLQPLDNVRVPEKEGFRLSCKFSGEPKPTIKWYKDGERVFPYGRLQLLEHDDGTCELVVDSSSRQDAGGYRCVAENSFGSVRTTCEVSVIRTSRFGSSSRSSGNYLSTSLSMSAVGSSSWTPSSSYNIRSSSPSTNYRSTSPSYVRSTSPYVSSSIRSSTPYLRSSSPVPSSFNQLERSYSSSRGYGGLSSWYSGGHDSEFYDYTTKERKPRDLDSAMSSGKAPGFTIPLTIRRAKPGESVTFECLPFGQPFPTIKWLKDGLELVADEKISMESDADGTQKLTLKNISFFAEGYYRCVATNIHGTASTKAELVVEGDRSLPKKALDENAEPEESKPRIRRGLHNMSIHQGNVVEMIVCATGWPTPTVKWFKDGQEIITDGPDGRRVIFTDERGVHHLVILNCEPGDEGEYSLEATNKLGSARTEGSLNVIRPRVIDDSDDRGGIPYPPGFVRQLKNKHVFNHMPTIFDCLVVGHPPPEVEWFHNGKRIVLNSRIKIQSCGGGSHAIIILDTTLEDAGEYVAVAKNSHGSASSSAILDVTVPHLDNIKFDGSFDVSSYLTEEYGFKKVNYASLPTPPDHGPFIKEVTGHFLTLSWIPTKRAPPRYPQVTYVIEIRELPEKEWTLLDYNIPEPVCKVRNLELGKSYQFRVRAENIYGISDPSPASPPSRLMAPPQPVFDKRTQKVIPLLDPYAEKALDLAHAEQYACAPWFAPGVVEKRYCAENDSLTIILNVSGYPDPDIQWKFRGWNIDTTSPTSKCKVYTYGGTETTLSIMGFSRENVGQYQCFAKNAYGEAQQNIMVDLATRPSFIQPLSNKTFSSAHPMKLDVRVDGQPFPELKWMKDWRPIVESSRIKFVQDGPYLCSLIVNDPLWRDSGIYTCVAVNEAGQATTSCTVTVEADGDYNDVELPKKRVAIEARKVREVYDIDEEDEKRAVSGAPFTVKERSTGQKFLAQLKPIDDSLNRNIDIHNVLEHPNVIQFKQIIKDNKIAMVVYDNSSSTILNDLAHPGVPMGGPTGQDRERMVQIFIRYLVLALEKMHELRIAHLDLRPETILLQDDRLKLADFGQSRRLLRGLITGQIQGTPEFVSPEIVRGYPLTLATDLWSVGTITYVLLTGQSPFHGDNDEETLANVDKINYSLDGPEWSSFSSEARDFVSKLLCEIPADRLTCKEALQHEWLSSKDVLTAPLPADGLREFNYTHKWLERRVFVQQTPSEQLLDAILAPSIALAQQANSKKHPRETDRPVELYDYLRIKPRPPPEIVDIPKRRIEKTPHLDQFGNPIDEHYLNQPPPYAFNDPNFIEPFNPQAPSHPSDPRRNSAGVPQPPNIPSGHPHRDQREQRDQRRIPLDQYGRLIRAEDLVRVPHDQYGRPIDIDEKQFLSPENLPRLDESRIRQILAPGHPGKGGSKGPQQSYPEDALMTEKRKLEPQTKGETPSKSRRDQPKQQRDSDDSEDDSVHVPVRMVRGERRDIEEEIANRILSDISEEGSVAGSLGSLEDFEQINTIRQKYTKKSRSRSSTPKAESDASTPTLSPVNTVKESNFFPDTTIDELPLHEQELLEQADNDPNIPIGAPLFLEGLHNNTLIIDTAPTPSPNLLTPRSPRRSEPGTKSPVLLSPGKEHSMEVLIATKRGKPSFLPPGEQAAEIDDEDAHMDDRKKKIKPIDHSDDFEDLKEDLQHRKKLVDDLDKYRPSNFYKDVDFNHPGYDIDDSPWDSHYQIGPDTYLMASRGPSFNSRVRDYRRELWGDGAPLVRQGILGVRNGEVTVKERRRFTDILREHSHNIEPKSNERATSLQKAPSATNALDRIRSDIQKVAPSATRRNADGTYAPIFITRMRDAYLGERSAVFECSVTGSPAPTVEWTFHNQVLVNDDKRTIEQNGNIHRLIIHKPLPYDLGEYLCTATNEFGNDKTTSRLISGEAPSRPGRPDAELSSDTEIFLTWEAPEGHTYLEGITYRLEYRPAGPDDVGAAWIVISENVDDEAVAVKHLRPFGIYQFRVTARNGFGLGLPSLSSRIIQTHGKGAAKLQIEILKSYVRLNVVSLPQKSANQLNEISEESESEDKTLHEQFSKGDIQLQTDDVLSRFQIDALIYRGRFGVVRKAVDNSQEGSAHCIAKIRDVNEETALREYEILKDAQHENVQRLIAAYNREGFLYLFCEQLYEDVFSRFVFNDYYTEEQVCMTMRQVASALHWLHFRGIAHLDINPHNIMFQSKRNWIVKLIDFGSSQKLSTAVKPKEFNVLWAAPEFHVDDVPVTVQSDVWGMGVITFCLLGGFHPFTSEYDEITEVKNNVLNVKCDPNLIPVNASQESLSFVTWALKKSPMRRMRTDEALSHRFLSADPSMVRRREAVKYSASRLRKTVFLTKKEQDKPISDSLENKFGGPIIQ